MIDEERDVCIVSTSEYETLLKNEALMNKVLYEIKQIVDEGLYDTSVTMQSPPCNRVAHRIMMIINEYFSS